MSDKKCMDCRHFHPEDASCGEEGWCDEKNDYMEYNFEACHDFEKEVTR